MYGFAVDQLDELIWVSFTPLISMILWLTVVVRDISNTYFINIY